MSDKPMTAEELLDRFRSDTHFFSDEEIRSRFAERICNYLSAREREHAEHAGLIIELLARVDRLERKEGFK